MSRLTLPGLYLLAKELFNDHPKALEFNILYEVLQNLLPSEPLIGETEKDFAPQFFAGLGFSATGVVFTTFHYPFGKAAQEPPDMFGIIEALPGIPVTDLEKMELISYGSAKSIAVIAIDASGASPRVRLYRHFGIERAEAVGFLKSAVDMARSTVANTNMP